MKQVVYQLETLSCPTCVQKIEAAVKRVAGVDQDKTKVLFNASKVKTEFDETITSSDDIKDAIEAVGYNVLNIKER